MTHQEQSRTRTKQLFGKTQRLLKGAEFDAVFAKKLSAGDGVLLVYARANELGRPRLGLVVSRKVGKAVVRNRWKRTMREAFRLSQHELPSLDLVCLPKLRGEPTLAAVRGSLSRLATRLQKKHNKRV